MTTWLCSPYGHIVYPLAVFFPNHKSCGIYNYICHDPSFGLMTKARACKDVSHEWSPGITFHVPGSVGGCEGGFHFGSWSPNGLSNFQKVITGVKTHWIEKFIIPLERSWNVNVWSELTCPIWVLKTQIKAERRVESQSANLTSNH
jgi:hypothetical protein